MQVRIPFAPYVKAAFGRPWGSKVIAWPEGRPATTEWGTYVPTQVGRNEGGGAVVIEAQPGDVLRWGQKPKTVGPGAPDRSYPWGIVMADGTVREVSLAEASLHYRNRRPGSPPSPPPPAPSPAPAPGPAPTPAPAMPPAAEPRPPTPLHIATLERAEALEAALRSIVDPVECALVTAEGFRERARRIVREALAKAAA